MPDDDNLDGDPSPADVGQAVARQGDSPPPGSAVAPCPEKLTWIEISLMDAEGNMVPNEPYRIIDPSNSKHEGRLDGNGHARVDNIKPGTCQITFPKRDQEAWDRV
jgi:hypothetical protein